MNPQRPKISFSRLLGLRGGGAAGGDAAPVSARAAADTATSSVGLGQRLRQYPCFDFQMYVDPHDPIAWPIVNHAVYEHHIMPVFREIVRPGMHVLDIGANIGVYSVAAARLGARVTAVDASPENCKLVQLNAQLNGVDVRALPFAVSDEPGMALFARINASNKAINRFAGLSLETFDTFDAAFSQPIDQVVGNDEIDVVKIDIDGREYAALKGADRVFEQRPVFFLEYARDLTMPGSGVPPLDLLRLFTSRGYSMTVIGLRGPNQECGLDVEAVDRIARIEREEADCVCIDLLMRPPA